MVGRPALALAWMLVWVKKGLHVSAGFRRLEREMLRVALRGHLACAVACGRKGMRMARSRGRAFVTIPAFCSISLLVLLGVAAIMEKSVLCFTACQCLVRVKQ